MSSTRKRISEDSARASKSPRPNAKTQTKEPQANAKASSQHFVTHLGGCHCGAVRFSVQAPAHLDVVQCNCSVCGKKQNHHFIVPQSRFKLLKGSDSLTTYTFNTHKAKHTFCKVCGVQSFYTPRSNQDGRGIMPHCLDSGTVESTTITTFDGIHWEATIKTSDIAKYSKEEPVKRRKRL